MAGIAVRHSVVALVLGGLLAGCVDSEGAAVTPFAPAASAKPGGDIEAPEVFQTTDTALWDGRPSLGGIWVASPDAVDPERVLMENLATGLTVEGALFRRERDNPGPALQLSSDAAEALGVLAGQPVELRVTALRRAEPEVPVQTEVAPTDPAADPASDVAADGGSEAGPEGTAAVAAAALAEAEGAPAAADAGAADAGAADAGATDAGAAVVTAAPKTAKERRAEARAAREAKKAAEKAAKAEAAAAADGAVEGTAAGIGVEPIDSAPLDARSAEVSDAAAAAAGETAPTDEAERKTPATTSPEAAPATGTPAGGTARPIQIATFSQEANATRAIADLAKLGVTAQVRKTEVGGKPVWGIMATGDVAALKTIRGAGYPDAYFLQ